MKLKLINKIQEAPNVYSFVFEPENELHWQAGPPATPVLAWRAGQFLQYTLKHSNPDERGIKRYFTISLAPHEKNIMLTTRFNPERSSTFKDALFKLQIGQMIEAAGPNGNFIIEDPQKQYVFISGGIGITPFRSIVLDLDYKNLPINATLIYGNRDENVVFKNTFDEISKRHPEFQIKYLIDPERISPETIKENVPNLKVPLFYVSGPKPMVQSIEEVLVEIGAPEENIKHDYFPGYEDF